VPVTLLNHGPQFVPVLARLEPEQVEQLRELARRTRVRQAVFLREAVTDLLEKHGQRVAGDQAVGD
jgi:predicted transcriptional regulator